MLDLWLRTTPGAKFSTDESPSLALVLTLIEGLGLHQIAARILHELALGVRAAEAVGIALDRRIDGAIRLHVLVIGETPGTHVAELAGHRAKPTMRMLAMRYFFISDVPSVSVGRPSLTSI